MYNDGDDDDETTKSNDDDDDGDRSLVHRSVNGTSIMKQDDGDGDMFLSQIRDIYSDRKKR